MIEWSEKLSSVVQTLKPSGIRQFFDIVATRKDCISLGVGEPDFVTPQVVIDHSIQALRDGYTHYTGNSGFLSLRREIARYLEKEYNLSYNPEKEILITVGVSQGVDLAFRALLNPGDGVLYPEPCYVSYDPMIRLAGGIPQKVLATAENDFSLKAENISGVVHAGGVQSKVLFLNYPSNPTGASIGADELRRIARLAEEKNLIVISDEIYGELNYEGEHVPFPTLPGMKERTLLLGGFSKAFAMTGWRIGYACGDENLIKSMTKIHQYSMLCAPTLGQIAAETALKYALADRDRMRDEYRLRRDLIVKGFNDMGLKCFMPQGAFYVFPDIRSTGKNSMQFATELLEAQNVAVVPGTAFGDSGEGFIRCSYATARKEIEAALTKIAAFVKG
ncbi:MAG TPA: aminotransferase class I/II-fold pyridoxal phosphate-dependent enzyme [Turneriella sp.]|nr:aminotransferase class I/II-fold pyridoxal phosphate-dependent enzyme [Turneriella sp.]HNL54596.1 aminotransferase class I/II-fold pyridoxal phosphate-dependent enzyme [Turneriella sp.]